MANGYVFTFRGLWRTDCLIDVCCVCRFCCYFADALPERQFGKLVYIVFTGLFWQVGIHCVYRSVLASWCTLCLQVCSGKLVYIVFTGLFWLVEDHWPLDVCHGLKSASG